MYKKIISIKENNKHLLRNLINERFIDVGDALRSLDKLELTESECQKLAASGIPIARKLAAKKSRDKELLLNLFVNYNSNDVRNSALESLDKIELNESDCQKLVALDRIDGTILAAEKSRDKELLLSLANNNGSGVVEAALNSLDKLELTESDCQVLAESKYTRARIFAAKKSRDPKLLLSLIINDLSCYGEVSFSALYCLNKLELTESDYQMLAESKIKRVEVFVAEKSRDKELLLRMIDNTTSRNEDFGTRLSWNESTMGNEYEFQKEPVGYDVVGYALESLDKLELTESDYQMLAESKYTRARIFAAKRSRNLKLLLRISDDYKNSTSVQKAALNSLDKLELTESDYQMLAASDKIVEKILAAERSSDPQLLLRMVENTTRWTKSNSLNIEDVVTAALKSLDKLKLTESDYQMLAISKDSRARKLAAKKSRDPKLLQKLASDENNSITEIAFLRTLSEFLDE